MTAALAILSPGPAKAEIAPTTSAVALPAPSILVRAGAHKDFDRVVFDWPREVKFQLSHEGSHASVTFDASANMQFTPDVASQLTRAHGFNAHADDANHVTVSFTVDPDTQLKAFASGSSVVIDITGKNAPEAKQQEVKQEAKKEIKTVADQPVALVPAQSPAKAEKAKPETPKPETQPTAAPATPPSDAAPAPHAAPLATVTPIPPTMASPPSSAPLPELSDTPELVATLDTHAPARAVIFQRAGYAYIVFEHKMTIPPEALATGKAPHVNIQPIELPKNSGYRFAVPPNAELQATRDDTAWKIFLSKPQSSIPVTTTLVAQPNFALGARFILPLPDANAPEPIHMTDPVVGDDLILLPLGESQAFNVERHMADFNILPAAQGLVIKPLTDKIVLHPITDGVEITGEGGLLLSRTLDTGASQESSALAKAAASGKSIFDFATWAGKTNETFTQARQRLQQTIVDVPEIERNRARLELARFYFANGDGLEAIALLNMLAKNVPDLRTHGDFLSLLGAAEILAARPDDGLRDLSSPQLTDQPEVKLWQAIGLAEQRDWQGAEEKFATTESILAGYPEPFFSRFMVLAIESALAAGKDHEAADWLAYISNAPHESSADPAISYLHGVLEAKAGRAGSAEDSWKEAQASKDRLYKVRAELALIDLGVSTGSLTPAQAADRLETMRFAWRGDDLEVDILNRLGQFYIQAKNVKAGLNTLSQALLLYPASPLVPQIHTEMVSIFHEVFLGDIGKKLSPLDALTLYQQYRDLMPPGNDGDIVMRNLAERLVSIDLLDQAASILDDLARNHLKGEEKDRAALRLAGIRLLDHKPDDALSALDIIGQDTLQPATQNERTLLRARALSELHRDADATALLKDNSSDGAKMLRADIAMHAQNWDDASKALMDLVGPPPAAGTTLTPSQANWLINAAIAYALANNQTGLDKLAIDYGAAMAATSQNNTFRLLTEPEKSGQLRDLAAAQSQISQVDMFQDFLNSYRAAPASSDANSAQAPAPANP